MAASPPLVFRLQQYVQMRGMKFQDISFAHNLRASSIQFSFSLGVGMLHMIILTNPITILI